MLGMGGGARKRGRPRARWLDDIKAITNCTLTELCGLTRDRDAWREMVLEITRSRPRLDGTIKITSNVGSLSCMNYRIIGPNINYYHYQPESNIIIVGPILQTHTHAHTDAHTHQHTHIARARTRTRTHTRTLAHTHMHARTHACMHATHTLSVIITHYKRMGYVIIHKPNCSGREGINSRCRRFDLLPFHHFGSTSRRYDRSCRRSGSVCSMGRCRPTVTQLPPLFDGSLAINRAGRWFMQINTRASDTVSASFSRIKNC